RAAFDAVGLDWERYVRFDPKYERPSEVDALIGDASKAKSLLDWSAKVQFDELARIMVESDVRQLEDELSGQRVRVDR
ncbi:GDP-mannose 4,6-dehydratase, partial [Streptomyces sp. bgisy084]|uniref:GDP-mannose 4,6-dehydratase n=1 Tax=unclassified Streptomyces TaxID=2593676 RepID=UPI003D74057F